MENKVWTDIRFLLPLDPGTDVGRGVGGHENFTPAQTFLGQKSAQQKI